MTLGARRTLVALILSVVVLAVIGLLYLQAFAQQGATRSAWLVTQSVTAGTTLNDGNVKQVRVPASGDQFTILTDSPVNKQAARDLAPQTLLRSDDIAGQETALVPITLRANPPLKQGDVIDVFAFSQGTAVLVGQRLTVINPSNPVVVSVSSDKERYWAALLASDTALYATESPSVTVAGQAATTPADAIAGLSGLPPPVATGTGR
jgi:hypothetical protein